jgi:antitoxin PrlF
MSRIESTAKLTTKSQTTLPIAVRKALSVGPEDKIVFTIMDGGRVEVRKADTGQEDPVVSKYLTFLQEDMLKNPRKLSVLQRDPVLRDLLNGVETEQFELSEQLGL